MKKALVLSGGAVLGAYQVGVLTRCMIEEGQEYDILCGSSVGALNAAFLAQFTNGKGRSAAHELSGLWESIRGTGDIYKNWLLPIIPGLLWRRALYTSEPLWMMIQKAISTEGIRNSGKVLRVPATCLDTDEFYYGKETDEEILKWVLASSAFPGIMCPVEIDSKLWVDGGVKKMTPLGEAIRAGADEIDVIMCSNPDAENKWDASHKNALTVALRSVQMLTNEMLKNDLRVASLKNDLTKITDEYKNVAIRVIMPKGLLVENSFSFDPQTIMDLIELGYEDSRSRWKVL